jgi:putative redox protein
MRERNHGLGNGASERGIVVARGGPAGFAHEIAIGPHRLRADEPFIAGGTETGPTPYDLLLASLGS